eukprot:gene5768-9589_t
MKLKVGIFLLLFIIAQVLATPNMESNVLSVKPSPTWSGVKFKCFVKCSFVGKKLYTLDTTTLSKKEKQLLLKASDNICPQNKAKKCSCKNVLNYVDVYTHSPAIEERINFLKSKQYCPQITSAPTGVITKSVKTSSKKLHDKEYMQGYHDALEKIAKLSSSTSQKKAVQSKEESNTLEASISHLMRELPKPLTRGNTLSSKALQEEEEEEEDEENTLEEDLSDLMKELPKPLKY